MLNTSKKLHNLKFFLFFCLIGFQKVAECMKQAAELLGRKRSTDIDCAVSVISEGLMISSYSEKLLQMKVDALLMVCFNIKRNWFIYFSAAYNL